MTRGGITLGRSRPRNSLLETDFEQRTRPFEPGRIPVERFEEIRILRVHRFERLLQRGAQRRRRRAADDDRQQRVRALLDPDREVADFQRLQPLVLADLERVLHEVADGGEHAGHHVGVLRRRPRCRHVLQQQTRGAVDQEHLLDAVDQRVEQDDFGERPAGPPRVEPPLERTPRQAVLERAC